MRSSLAIALMACAGLAAACGSSSSSSSSASAHAPVKVGYLLPLTGVFTKNGLSEQDGFKLGLRHFGSSVDGHPIQVTYANDQGEPAVSLSDARQLITANHVQVVEGPLVSSAIAAVAPHVLGRGIPASTQAVFVVLSGTQAANFVNAYQSFGLKKKIPLMGITTFPAVPPWGTLSQSAWEPIFAKASVSPPSY